MESDSNEEIQNNETVLQDVEKTPPCSKLLRPAITYDRNSTKSLNFTDQVAFVQDDDQDEDFTVQKQGNLPINLSSSGTKQGNLPINLPSSGTKQGNLSFNLPSSGTKQGNLSFNLPSSGTKQGNLPFHLPSSGTKQGNLPINLPSSGTKQGNLPFHLPSSGTKQGNLPINLPSSEMMYLPGMYSATTTQTSSPNISYGSLLSDSINMLGDSSAIQDNSYNSMNILNSPPTPHNRSQYEYNNTRYVCIFLSFSFS